MQYCNLLYSQYVRSGPILSSASRMGSVDVGSGAQLQLGTASGIRPRIREGMCPLKSHPSPSFRVVARPWGKGERIVTVFYRGPEVVVTHKLVRVRVAGGWRVWVLAELRDLGVVHTGPPPVAGMWALGSSAVLVELLAFRLKGWVLPVALVMFAVALVVAYWERRRARDRSRSQLWATYRDHEVVVFELRRDQFEAAVRGLVRALDQRDGDTR